MAKAKAKETSLETAKTHIGRAVASKFPVVFQVLFGIVLVLVLPFRPFDRLDNLWSDFAHRSRGVVQADKRVVVVAIDDDTLEHVKTFPIPRRHYEKLIDNIFKLGAASVGLDIMFTEPSNPFDDAALIRVTKRHADRLVHAARFEAATGGEGSHNFAMPFPDLMKVTKHVAFVNQLMIDQDGSVRATNIFIGKSIADDYDMWIDDPSRVSALGVKTLSLGTGTTPEEWLKKAGATNAVRLRIAGERIETREQKDKVFKYYTYGVSRVSAGQILKGEKDDLEKLKGAIVLVGSTASGWFDHFPSPFTDQAPGVEVHANLIDNLLNASWLKPIWIIYTILLSLGAVIVTGQLIVRLSPLWASVGWLALMSGWVAACHFYFSRGLLLSFWPPFVALSVNFIVLLMHRTIEENRKAAEVRGMFGQYVPPEVVDILVKNPERLKLGGDKRDMTIFFLDIAHFTTISEKMTPEALIQFLNRYLTALTDDIFANNGVVDKYIGDCIMAFWNAPLDEKDHRRKACLAAVACVKTIERLNKEFLDPSMPETPTVRIGLNSGEVVVGNTGSARKLAYTVLGDDVNLASRLEGANKFFGSTLMASEDTYAEGKDVVDGRLLGAVRVVGKAIPIKVYELLAKKGELPANWAKGIPIYHEAIVHYENKRFQEALDGFTEFLKHVPDDKTAKLYMNACNDYVVIPPPEGWEPVFNLTSK